MCQKCHKNGKRGIYNLVQSGANFLTRFFSDVNCLDCSKEEDAETMVPLECSGRSCVYNNLTNRFVPLHVPTRETLRPVKETVTAATPLTTVEGNALSPQQRHSKIVSHNLA